MASKPKKIFHFEELVKHKDRESCWVLIHNKVFDVTDFLLEHPGGDDVLLASTVIDASDSFDDIGHSESAIEMMEKYYIGDIDVDTIPLNPAKEYGRIHSNTSTNNSFRKLLQFLLPLLILPLLLLLKTNI